MFSQEHPLESTGHALTATACDLLEVTGVTVEISGAIDANMSATGSFSPAAMPPTALQPLFMVNANVVEDKTMEPALPGSPIHESPPVRRVIMAEDSPPHSRYSYSAALQVLAVVRSPTNELSVRGSGRREFSALLPSGECIDVAWDPMTETHLAVAIRGVGVALWDGEKREPPHIWSRAGKDSDPLVQRWSKSAQLVIGLADGSFVVYDARTSSFSYVREGTHAVVDAGLSGQRSGCHRSGVTAAAWALHDASPALALGSASTIKVSRGSTHVRPGEKAGRERRDSWSTAMKVRLAAEPLSAACSGASSPPSGASTNGCGGCDGSIPGSGARSSLMPPLLRRRSRSASGGKLSNELLDRQPRLDDGATPGCDVLQLGFCSSGRYLAALLVSERGGETRLVVYELQNARRHACSEHPARRLLPVWPDPK